MQATSISGLSFFAVETDFYPVPVAGALSSIMLRGHSGLVQPVLTAVPGLQSPGDNLVGRSKGGGPEVSAAGEIVDNCETCACLAKQKIWVHLRVHPTDVYCLCTRSGLCTVLSA